MTEARQALLTRIDSEVRAYRAALEAETRETCGELSAADALLLDAICDTERIRQEAVAQIAGKGVAGKVQQRPAEPGKGKQGGGPGTQSSPDPGQADGGPEGQAAERAGRRTAPGRGGSR